MTIPYKPDPVQVALGKLACAVLSDQRVLLDEVEAKALWQAFKGMQEAAEKMAKAYEAKAQPTLAADAKLSPAELELVQDQRDLIANPGWNPALGGG